ncbi:DUF2663 family protein [bacterium LRH843]|nr:DUF2663 family protein [bacterium LRH843]
MNKLKESNSISRSYGPNIVMVMMEELISRQKKLDKYEKARTRWSWLVLFLLAILLFWGYKVYIWYTIPFNSNILSTFTKEPFMLTLLLLIAVGLIQLKYFVKKSTKAEKEFEELRMEFIERNSELWSEDESWKQREVLLSFMKKEHDINLYHK